MRVRIGARRMPLPEQVFLDTNLIVDVVVETNKHHRSASDLFAQLVRAAHVGAATVYTSPLVLDEVWWKLAQVLYEGDHGEGAWRKVGRKKRKLVLRQYAGELTNTTQLILSHGVIQVAPVVASDVPRALRHVLGEELPHLDPRDAFHLAVMERLEIQAIATGDPDFSGVPALVALDHTTAAEVQ